MTSAPGHEHRRRAGRERNGAGRAARAALILAAALGAGALAGCETVEEYTPDVGFQVLTPSQPPAPTTPEVLENAVKRPVTEVTSLEVGALRKGRLLTAHGLSATGGWFQAELVARGTGPSRDGFLEYDFIAAPPELNGGAAITGGAPARRRVRADIAIDAAALSGVVGLRVYGAEGVAAVRLIP